MRAATYEYTIYFVHTVNVFVFIVIFRINNYLPMKNNVIDSCKEYEIWIV
jgi:hypothetical protein